MSTNLGTLSLDDLIAEYVQTAVLIGLYSDSGDYSKGNAQYFPLVHAYREIMSRGSEGKKRHVQLLDHDVLSVKVWAAAHALEYAPQIAESTLSDIAKNAHGIQRFNAEITLREWKAGRLKFEGA